MRSSQKGGHLVKKILVAFDSEYGATSRAAEIIAATLIERGLSVDLHPVGDMSPVGYDALILGSPIRLGQCTSRIKKFLKKNSASLASIRVAFFFTCMSVTNNTSAQEFPLYIDPSFNWPDKPHANIKLMETNHTAAYYLSHFLKFVPGITPWGVAFFKGSLDTKKLSPAHRLIMWLAMFALPEIKNGDFLNPIVIGSWTETILSETTIEKQPLSGLPALGRRHIAMEKSGGIK